MKNLAAALDELQEDHQWRSRNLLSSAQQIEPVINGRKVLSFCSNDYLGLACEPRIIERYVEAAKTFGVGSGASHLITGHHACHHALEEELADFLGCERTLLFSTGYMANLGLVGALAGRDTTVYQDRLSHASLIDAAVLARAHLKRYDHLAVDALHRHLRKNVGKDGLIATDGVFSMDGTVAPIEALQKLADSFSVPLVVDDAHGIGVLGEEGKGCTEGCRRDETILVGTLGKAFGVFGAFVAARADIIEWCVQRARSYIYTTALPPSVAEAARTALALIREEPGRRAKLLEQVAYFRQCAREADLPVTASRTPIQPIVLGDSKTALEASRALLEEGILVQAIREPTVPKHQARLRVTLCATHTRSHIDRLIDVLTRSCSRSGEDPS
ncbi:MAG: 8-amino-7-oxononanoate synthase [Proteobacteria bacterium]|nr:8-amino-7-oxononanoate synthase [Pseudomonadota bacterium]